MTLREWLDRNKVTVEVFADRIGTHHSSVSRYAGGRMPRKEVLKRIKEATDGQVTADDFLDDDEVTDQQVDLPKAS